MKCILIIWIIGFILMILSNYIINYKILPNNISGNEELNRTLLFNHKFTYTLLLSIIIPFLEEISNIFIASSYEPTSIAANVLYAI